MLGNWTILKSELILKTPWFELRRDQCRTPEGIGIPKYYTWKKRDCVIVFPITREKQVLLIRQYRHGVKRVCVDYPGGTIEDGQSVLDAAGAELSEETGYRTESYIRLGTYLMDSSYSNQRVHFVLALECDRGYQSSNPQEVTEVLRVPLERIERFAEENVECLLCRHLTVDAVNKLEAIKGGE